MGVKRLSLICKAILKEHVTLIRDVGDAPFELVEELLQLPSMTADQLHELEDNSPHLYPDTDEIWKNLCVKDFVTIRAAVEDGIMLNPPTTWRELHAEETEKREIRMAELKARMRGQYHEARDGRATTKEVDGVRAEKRRRLNSGSNRPKLSLMDKARQNSRRISSIYAPRHRKPQQHQQITTPAPGTSFISGNKTASTSKLKAPKVVMVTRTVQVPKTNVGVPRNGQVGSSSTKSNGVSSPRPPLNVTSPPLATTSSSSRPPTPLPPPSDNLPPPSTISMMKRPSPRPPTSIFLPRKTNR